MKLTCSIAVLLAALTAGAQTELLQNTPSRQVPKAGIVLRRLSE